VAQRGGGSITSKYPISAQGVAIQHIVAWLFENSSKVWRADARKLPVMCNLTLLLPPESPGRLDWAPLKSRAPFSFSTIPVVPSSRSCRGHTFAANSKADFKSYSFLLQLSSVFPLDLRLPFHHSQLTAPDHIPHRHSGNYGHFLPRGRGRLGGKSGGMREADEPPD
jgi:hypothetical protein